MKYRCTIAFIVLAVVACGDNKQPSATSDAGVDAGPVDVPIERAHSGGSPEAIQIVGTRAYIAVGPRLTIWELGGERGPSLVGEAAPVRGVIHALAVVGNRAFVAEHISQDSRLHVFDVSDPSAPVQTAEVSFAGTEVGSVILDLEPGRGDRLYAADHDQGVLVIDIANPDAPSLIRIAGGVGVTGLDLDGNRLYYLLQGFLGDAYGVLDTAIELEDLGGSGVFGQGVAFAGDLMIAAGPDGIFVHDVSDPTDPVERFAHARPDGGPFARTIAVRGTTAYVPADDGLHVLDLSDPDAIGHEGPIEALTQNAEAAFATDELLAITTDQGRLLTFAISTPTQPAPASVVDVTLCADCFGVDAVDTTLIVADAVGGLRTARLADLAPLGRSPALPIIPMTGGLQLVFDDVELAGEHAYVADWMFGLRVYDVSNPAALVHVGSLRTGGYPSGIAVAGDRAFVTEGTDGGSLRAIDISNPAKPTLLGTVLTSHAVDVEVRDGLAYVADQAQFESGGLRIFDVSDPASLREVGVYEGCPYARDVALVANLAILACAFDYFHIVDVSTPSAPKHLATVEAPGTASAWSVAAWDGYAVLGHDHGVIVVSLANPAAPVEVATMTTAFTPATIVVPTPGRIVAACGLGGVYQWNVGEGR